MVDLGIIQQYQNCGAFSGQIGQFTLVGGHRGSVDYPKHFLGFCGFIERSLRLILKNYLAIFGNEILILIEGRSAGQLGNLHHFVGSTLAWRQAKPFLGIFRFEERRSQLQFQIIFSIILSRTTSFIWQPIADFLGNVHYHFGAILVVGSVRFHLGFSQVAQKAQV